ncbi:MAG: hypothetical protein AB7O97_03830 [Planctomycetota bacterium]
MNAALAAPMLFALCALTPAQVHSASFTPNPVAPGQSVTMTVTDATGFGCNLSSPCGWYRIHQGSQTGPQISLGLFCPQVIVPVPPNGTFSFTWDQRDDTGALVPPGVYWVEVRTLDVPLSAFRSDWFCISIQPATAPALTATGPVRIGQVTPIQVSAPSEPGAIYLTAVGFSANAPIVLPGLDICMAAPLYLDFVVAPIGALDLAGQSSGLAIVLPNAPVGIWQALHVQTLLSGPSGLVVTNSLTFTIQP